MSCQRSLHAGRAVAENYAHATWHRRHAASDFAHPAGPALSILPWLGGVRDRGEHELCCTPTDVGSGVGGLHLFLRLAWAAYYGRRYLGTIWGITLPVQIGGQAVGPVAAGFVLDATGSYHGVFLFFAGVVVLGSVLVLTDVPPSSAELAVQLDVEAAS
jgi:MFS family permease